MKIYVKINNLKIEATVYGQSRDMDWDDRESKAIHTKMTYEQAKNLFVDGASWSIIQEFDPVPQPDGSTITPPPMTYDNSDFCLAGAITDHRDGTVSIKMGKKTEVEIMQEQLANVLSTNVLSTEELDQAYMEGVNSL